MSANKCIKLHILKYENRELIDNEVYEFPYVAYKPVIYNVGADNVKGGVYGGDEIDESIFDISDLNVDDSDLIFEGEKTKKKITIVKEAAAKKSSKIIRPIYYDDSTLDFKRKIQIETGIPLFRQHLFYSYDNSAYQLSYRLMAPAMQKIDIRKIDETDYIEDVPIDGALFAKKEDIVVESYDEYRIMRDIVNFNVFDFYLVDMNEFFANRTHFESYVNDAHTRDLLYYSFIIKYYPFCTLSIFIEYIKNEKDIQTRYPEIAPFNEHLIATYNLEDQIRKKLYDIPKAKLDLVKQDIQIGITHSIVYQRHFNEVNLRNLFDKFELSDTIPYMRCKCTINNVLVNLQKTYKGAHVFREKLGNNSALFSILVKLPNDLYTKALLIISINGSYYVETEWRSDFFINYDNMFQILEDNINPIIARINEKSHYVLNKPLLLIDKITTKITDLSMSIYWKKTLDDANFKNITNMLNDFVKCDIVAHRSMNDAANEYIFIKGMYKFNYHLIEDLVKNISNYYTRFTDANVKQKWDGLFNRNRLFRVNHRYADVKFDIFNIKEEERDIVFDYVSRMLALINDYVKSSVKEDITNVDRKLKKMKEMDPELYDFKKAYQSNEVLSKKCQKPLQPIIYSVKEYDELKKEKDIPVLEYWNFTENAPVYYHCPNPKYPFVRFITGIHPKGYCIPCCKKTNITDDMTNKKNIIHEACLKDHKYIESKDTDDKKSRYVSSYGKDLDAGRLAYLPEHILGSLFYEHSSAADPECKLDNEYLMLGVSQFYVDPLDETKFMYVGALHSIALLLDMSITDLINKLFAYIRDKPGVVDILLDEFNLLSISDIFTKDAGLQLIKIFQNYNVNGLISDNLWNSIFLKLASNAFNVYFIIFDIVGDQGKIHLPDTLNNVADLLGDRIGLILRKESDKDAAVQYYYPIIYADKIEYYKNELIEARIFKQNNKIINDIVNIINAKLSTKDTRLLDLYKMHIFCKENKYTILKYFVNSSNNCYALLITNEKVKPTKSFVTRSADNKVIKSVHYNISAVNKLVYVPIDLSYYNNVELMEYGAFTRDKYNVKSASVVAFIAAYNKFGSRYLWNDITIDKLLFIQGLNDKNKKYIGFSYQGLNFYMSEVVNIKAESEHRLYYDPDFVNTKMMTHTGQINDHVYLSLYKKYLYQLIIMEYMSFFNKEKNLDLRKRLLNILLGQQLTSASKSYNKVKSLTGDMAQLTQISNMAITHASKTIDKILKDYPKDGLAIKMLINEYFEHNDKQRLVKSFNEMEFMFDKTMLNELRRMTDKGKLIARLENIGSKIIIERDIKDISFPNIFISCQDGADEQYCKDKKLIVPKGKLRPMLDILAMDIRNPLKERILFSRININNVIDPYQFKKNLFEEITITF